MSVKPETPDPEADDEETMKPPEEMTEEELRLLADTMPGEGPAGD